MIINTIVIDDEPLYAWDIEQMLEELRIYNVLGVFQDANLAINFIQTTQTPIHLIILDIHLNGGMNGVQLAKSIVSKNIPIVFVTQDQKDEVYYSVESVPNHSFIVKPFHKFTIAASIRLLLSNQEKPIEIPPQNPLLYVRVGNKREVIESETILWIESSRNYCTIHTTEKRLIVRKSLKALIEMLPPNKFIHTHKSFVVALAAVKRVDIKERTVWINDTPLPLGRNFRKTVCQHLVHLG